MVHMIIGIESSCDESGIAVFDREKGVLWNDIFSQIDLHAQYGGVVPELAVREHVAAFPVLLERFVEHFEPQVIDSIAVTTTPGLPGCLAVGQAVAAALSVLLNRPVDPINHLEGHIFSVFIDVHRENPGDFPEIFDNFLPHLSLLVSGGNTCLQVIDKFGDIKILANTQDDAAGEAFDKGAKLLGLPYPGGRLIEKLAYSGNSKRYNFPRAYRDVPDLKFSFSGLKTSLRYFLENETDMEFERDKNDICASYQEAIIDAITGKFEQCIDSSIKSFGVCGGVSNNQVLCRRLRGLSDQYGIPLLIPSREYTGDNAAMIAFAAYVKEIFERKQKNSIHGLSD